MHLAIILSLYKDGTKARARSSVSRLGLKIDRLFQRFKASNCSSVGRNGPPRFNKSVKGFSILAKDSTKRIKYEEHLHKLLVFFLHVHIFLGFRIYPLY